MDNIKNLFLRLYNCHTESDLNDLLSEERTAFSDRNWNSLSCEVPHKNPNSNFIKIYPISLLVYHIKTNFNKKPLNSSSKDLQIIADGDLHLPSLTTYCSWNSLKIMELVKDPLFLGPLIYSKSHMCLLAQKEGEKVYFTLIKEKEDGTTKRSKFSIWSPNNNYAIFYTKLGLELNLFKKKFESGTIAKFFSYELPSGSRSVISRDLKRSIEEIMFASKHCFYIVDRKYRFPQDIRLEQEITGLNTKLQKTNNRYVKQALNKTYVDASLGKLQITLYLLNYSIDGFNYNRSLAIIKSELFKYKMSTAMTIEGIVRKYFGKDYLTAIGYHNIRHHILLHVDCDELIDQNFDTDDNSFAILRIKEKINAFLIEFSSRLANYEEEIRLFRFNQ